jgi:hypothetical protein
MSEELSNFIPEKSIVLVEEIFYQYPIKLKIVKNRKTKHGDFRRGKDGLFQITINNNLNPYQFLLTLIHEIAHYITYKQNGAVKPHGDEWKLNFQRLMLPFIQPSIYPSELLPYLAHYLKNPKASTGSDVKLTLALKQYDEKSGKNFIFELEQGSVFSFNNKTYKKGSIRRTRYECVEVESNRVYLFNQNAEVEILNGPI